ncbi:MAG: hypothetical protein P4M11_15420 [Candidatus Pacebacteria bacterium]|nr:hypothetical protein [Candidatus Paceibacterota bacterium]
MMEERVSGKTAKKSVWDKYKNANFEVFVEMLKGREVLRIDAVIFIVVAFLQIYGTVFEDSQHFRWEDDIAGPFVYKFFQIIRVIPMIESEQASSLYWLVFAIGSLAHSHPFE